MLISYAYFCTLKGLEHPNTWTRAVYNGSYYMYTEYHLTKG